VIRKDGLPDIGEFPCNKEVILMTCVIFLSKQIIHITFCYSTVVWNPWEEESKSIADLGNEEYKQMLCVDGAAVETPIILKPGEEWKGRLELSLLQSS